MKFFFLFIFSLLFFSPFAQSNSFFSLDNAVFINEIHYDNVGGDVEEGVEIAALSGTDLSCYKLYFVNGTNGTYYASLNLDSVVPGNSCGMGFVFFYKPSIQNGASTSGDAVALYDECNDSLIQFLSYEGAVTSTNGPFSGATSTDIGIFQDAAPIGTSLQLQGSLDSTFYWQSDSATYGQVNTQQDFCQTLLELSAIQLDSSCVLGTNESVSLYLENLSYSNSIDSIVIHFESNDSILLVDTIMSQLAVGDSVLHTFSQALDLSQVGDYQFEAWAVTNHSTSDTLLHHITLIDDDSILIVLDEYLVLCESNDSLLIEAQVSGADSWTWNTGDTTQQLLVFPATDTSFQLSAQNVCYVDTAWVFVDVIQPEINFIGISNDNGDTLYVDEDSWIEGNIINNYQDFDTIFLTTLENYEFYYYYYHSSEYVTDTIFESNDSLIVITKQDGASYIDCCELYTWIFLDAIDSNGCFIKDSVLVSWFHVGILETTTHPVAIYPNPSEGVFSMVMNELEPSETFSVEVLNHLRQVVQRQRLQSSTTTLNQSFDWSHLPKGLYSVHLHSKNRQAYQRLIIQ